jgi:hypothetical protein
MPVGEFEAKLYALFGENMVVEYLRGNRAVHLVWTADDDPSLQDFYGPGEDDETHSPAWWPDTGLSVASSPRPCPGCDVVAEAGGPDPCLGMLPGVKGACCGHKLPSWRQGPYVAFEDGGVLRDEDASGWFREHHVGPERAP